MDLLPNTARLSKVWCGARDLKTTFLLLPYLLALSSCGFSSSAMTGPDFDRIPRGASIATVVEEMGEPYNISSTAPGVLQHRYIERIETGPGQTSQNTYDLIVVDGQVIDKQRSNESKPINLQYR